MNVTMLCLFIKSEVTAEPGMNVSTNKQVCPSRSWKEWDVGKVGGAINYLWFSESQGLCLEGQLLNIWRSLWSASEVFRINQNHSNQPSQARWRQYCGVCKLVFGTSYSPVSCVPCHLPAGYTHRHTHTPIRTD
jgi:hypothetical protein